MSVFSLLISLFAVIFWVVRVAAAFAASMSFEFIIQPLNLPVEIILSFVTFACLIMIFKRRLLGALVYLLTYLGYFGVYLYDLLINVEEIVVLDYTNVLISVIGILLPLIILIDVGMSQSAKKTTSSTKKTDWFFQNKQFDREYDERADRNQYKF